MSKSEIDRREGEVRKPKPEQEKKNYGRDIAERHIDSEGERRESQSMAKRQSEAETETETETALNCI